MSCKKTPKHLRMGHDAFVKIIMSDPKVARDLLILVCTNFLNGLNDYKFLCFTGVFSFLDAILNIKS
ncbi:MAG: hypothetical protein COC15_02755 [Legionellales bacterium]|nr:MAG: hypothetical protein COC15_02755 [Legionellales bacterium]